MEKIIKKTFEMAKKALKLNEVPIGACIAKDGKIIATGFNKREKTQNALMHAEIVAINRACKKLGSWRLDGCDIFVTLEPCPMCAGAIANARIKNCFYFAKDTSGEQNLCQTILSSNRLNHKTNLVQLPQHETEAKKLLTDFFKSKRQQ